MPLTSAHHSALPHIRLFPRRRRWPILAAVTTATLIAITASAAVLATPAPRSMPAGGTVVLTAVTRPTTAQTVSAYRIRPGDTLSSIAARLCGSSSAYRSLAAANGIADPDLIYAGRTLWHVSCHASAGTARAARSSGGKVWGVSYGFPNYCGDGDGDGWDVPCSSRHSSSTVSSAARTYHRSYSSSRSYHGSSGCQARIIANESGGNSQVMNSSGHYGLYQFSRGTWEAHGGSASTFGHASVAEQNRVFYNTVAANGYRDWAASGGCG